jgi:hypothetical protein
MYTHTHMYICIYYILYCIYYIYIYMIYILEHIYIHTHICIYIHMCICLYIIFHSPPPSAYLRYAHYSRRILGEEFLSSFVNACLEKKLPIGTLSLSLSLTHTHTRHFACLHHARSQLFFLHQKNHLNRHSYDTWGRV